MENSLVVLHLKRFLLYFNFVDKDITMDGFHETYNVYPLDAHSITAWLSL